MNLVQAYIQRLSQLRSNRGNFNNQWEESASRVIPSHRYSFTSFGQLNAQAPGQKKTEEMYDATAALACWKFMSVIESLVTPQNVVWHRLTPIDKMLKKNRAARVFFEDVNDLLLSYRSRPVAGFVQNTQQTYLGLGAYGNGALYIDRPDQTPGLRYRNIHLGEAYFVENHAGIVDTMFRSFFLSARQIVQRFGEAAPKEVIEAAKQPNQKDRQYEILHVVEPRDDFAPMMVMSPRSKKWRSVYIAVEQQVLMREGGYDTFPYAVTRYTQAPGETYGRGPAQWVLPAIKVLNEEKRAVLKQGHMTVEPAYLTHDDGTLGALSLKAGKLNPGGLNADGKLMVQPLPVGRLDIGEKLMEMERQVINDAFLISLFQILVETPQMTATEVLERAKEKGMLLAPTAGRMQSEFLGTMIERELNLLSQQGLLPPVPSILQGADIEYKIEYENPMSRMARAEKAAGFTRALEKAVEYAQATGNQDALDWFDIDEAMPQIIDIHGAPVEWTRTMAQVEQIRQQRSQQAQEQQMMAAAPGMAAVMKAAPTMQK